MVDFGEERDLGRLERVVGWEGDVEEEDSAREGRVTLRANEEGRRRA